MTETQTVLTRAEVLAAFREIIKAQGEDYVYVPRAGYQCAYKWDNAPSCIVGHLMAKLTPDVFKSIGESSGRYGEASKPSNFASATYVVGSAEELSDGWHAPVLVEDAKTAGQIVTLQALQDSRTPWGEAFRRAFGEEV